MSQSSAALIGPSGLPSFNEESRWCPTALREKAWQGWRERGLPSKGVEDYLYMDWKRLESVEVAQPQEAPRLKSGAEVAEITLRSTAASELAGGKNCQVTLLSEADDSIQDDVATKLAQLVENAEHGIDLLRVALLQDAFLVEVAPESAASLKVTLEHDGEKSITAPLVVVRVGARSKLSVEDRIYGDGEAPSLALPLTLVEIEDSLNHHSKTFERPQQSRNAGFCRERAAAIGVHDLARDCVALAARSRRETAADRRVLVHRKGVDPIGAPHEGRSTWRATLCIS